MADLTLTFLGTGTSQGIPMIGCQCAVCQSSDPRDKRSRCSIYVKTPEAAWVVDTGPEFRCQCLREGLSRLDAALYTHSHADHIMGFDDLRRFCDALGGPLPVYASPQTMKDLRRVFEFAFSHNGNPPFPYYMNPDPREVTGPFKLGRTLITPLPVRHGKATAHGYLFSRNGRRLAGYFSDCKELSPEAIAQLEGVDALIVDALRHRIHPTHMNLSEALALALRVNARTTWLTHMSHELAHEETERTLPPNVRMAYDGLTLEF